MKKTMVMMARAAGVVLLAACGGGEAAELAEVAVAPEGVELEIAALPRMSYLRAAGVVSPVAEATLSTKLMGSVTEVLVHEGDAVRTGQLLLRLDARDLNAQRAGVEAAQVEAMAVLNEAELNVQRMRALYADEAAPRAQLDAAETRYERALAGVAGARASAAELAAVASYAEVRAPFAGTVVRRLVDPGSFAGPGAPLLVVQDTRRLRITASVSPHAVKDLARGAAVTAVIEDDVVSATVEGVVPDVAGLFAVNAIVDNPAGLLPAAGTATLALPQAPHTSIVVPLSAVRHQGDLTGVLLVREEGVLVRWVRLGAAMGDSVEVLSGLRDGDRILVPAALSPSGALPHAASSATGR